MKQMLHRDDADDDLNWMYPPRDLHDAAAWDRYWNGFVSHGFGPGFHDIMAADPERMRVVAEMGIKTVLCAGNGICIPAV